MSRSTKRTHTYTHTHTHTHTLTKTYQVSMRSKAVYGKTNSKKKRG